MKKIMLLITLALVHSNIQPVTREKLEKARNVTGIVAAVGMPATVMLAEKMNADAMHETIAAFDAGNPGQIQAAERGLVNTGLKSGLIVLAPGAFGAAHRIISSALEKDDVLAFRLMQYLMHILAAKTPPPADMDERINHLRNRPANGAAERMQRGRAVLDITADYLTKKEKAFESCSREETKAIVIEVAASIAHEILRYQLYKKVAQDLPGPDARISRRAIRATVHTLIIGLLELAKQKAANQWSPDSAHIYTPAKATFTALLGFAISEICGELLCTQIDEITENPENNTEKPAAETVENPKPMPKQTASKSKKKSKK